MKRTRVARYLAAFAAMLVWLPLPALAQVVLTDPSPIKIGERLTLQSRLLGEERQVMIRLPQDYEGGTQQFPVLYLLDGESHFTHVSGIVDNLTATGRIPAMIVVAVGNTNRNRDFSPVAKNPRMVAELPGLQMKLDQEIAGTGGADAFLKFLDTELAPAVEARYRTAPFRILVGHSFMGLFTAHALTTRPAAFDGYIAASPSLWWDDQALTRRVAQGFPTLGPRPRWLYMVTGEEGGAMMPALDSFRSVLQINQPKNLKWHAGIMPGETHSTTPHRVIYDGLQWMFRDYAASELLFMAGDFERLEQHYRHASRLYGFPVSLTENKLHEMGYIQIRYARPDRAVAVFRRSVAAYPDSPRAHGSLADGLKALGSHQEALKSRERAVQLAEAQGNPAAATYRKAFEQAKAEVAG